MPDSNCCSLPRPTPLSGRKRTWQLPACKTEKIDCIHIYIYGMITPHEAKSEFSASFEVPCGPSFSPCPPRERSSCATSACLLRCAAPSGVLFAFAFAWAEMRTFAASTLLERIIEGRIVHWHVARGVRRVDVFMGLYAKLRQELICQACTATSTRTQTRNVERSVVTTEIQSVPGRTGQQNCVQRLESLLYAARSKSLRRPGFIRSGPCWQATSYPASLARSPPAGKKWCGPASGRKRNCPCLAGAASLDSSLSFACKSMPTMCSRVKQVRPQGMSTNSKTWFFLDIEVVLCTRCGLKHGFVK